MANNEFPIRLENDPIVDCIIEVRFQLESETAVDIFPGVLYSQLKESFPEMHKTPVSEIPPKVRMIDENLKYQPTVEFRGQWGRVLVADCAVQIRVNYPYPGWGGVEPEATSILESVMNTGLIASYERISILYHNIIETNGEPHDLSPLALTLNIGNDLEAPQQGTLLRTELPHESGVSIVQVQTGAMAKIEPPGTPPKVIRGAHLSVDTIANGNIENFGQMKERLALVHGLERDIFFRMLKEETWKNMGPVWEN